MSGAITRRGLLGIGAGGLLLSGCDRIAGAPAVKRVLGLGEDASFAVQRLVGDRAALAPEFTPAQMSPVFRTNGNTAPASADYARHAAAHFADWRLAVTGMVARPLALSLDRMMAMPRRAQITRHDCVEGWSGIAKWTGTPLAPILRAAGVRRGARFVVFRCADDFGGTPYYESIDMVDAFHPQTILAWGMNGQRLPVDHGAPLRLRVERQLGYKQAKYVMGVEVVPSLADIGRGKGGYWEDVAGYQWYAGI